MKIATYSVLILLYAVATLNAEEMCGPPAIPTNAAMNCSHTTDDRYVCKVKCQSGFEFPDGKDEDTHECSEVDGKWTPKYEFHDCKSACSPQCQNNGTCAGGNNCICQIGYRGHRCEHPISLCNPSNKYHGSGEWNCNHTSTESLCVLTCPQGTKYEYPPANVYHCSMDGNWEINAAPKCIAINVFVSTTASESSNLKAKLLASEEAVCASWKNIHYRTFDNAMYNFEGKCTYLLAKDCVDNTFSIHVKKQEDDNDRSIVTIHVEEDKFILMNQSDGAAVLYNGILHKVPTTISGIIFEMLSDYLTVNSPLGFRLKWNMKSSVLIRATKQLKNKMCGLCGKYDGKSNTSLEMASGQATHSIEAFVDSWAIDDQNEKCEDAALTVDPCGAANSSKVLQANKTCSVIFDSKFAPCHAVLDPKFYSEACKMDFCACESADQKCICDSLAQYFLECRRYGGKIEGGWRSEALCPLSCPEDMTYDDCGTSCPKTCKETYYSCEDDKCVDGCHCPSGKVLHHGKCIIPKHCPCIYKGKEYDNKQSVIVECNKCLCLNGDFECTENTCGARCSSIGHAHYSTFDGNKYEYPGTCPMYLVYSEGFSIIQEAVPCPTSANLNNNNEHCAKEITINYGNSTLVLKYGLSPLLNGKLTKLPFSINEIAVYKASSLFTKVDLPNNATIMWDGKNRVYIDVPPILFDKTKGLCGTFNSHQTDDYLTPNGDFEPDISVFASRWQVSSACQRAVHSERTLCDLQPEKMEYAKSMCSILTNASFSFSSCKHEVDPEPYYKRCVHDVCSCAHNAEDCACPIFADYSCVCSKKGIIMEWSEEVIACKPTCEGGQVYHECGDPCKSSCMTIALAENCRTTCVQGCACPTSMTLNVEGLCIPVRECPCTYKGKSYAASASHIIDGQLCECENALWSCRKVDLNELGSMMGSISPSQNCSQKKNMRYTSCLEDCPHTCQNLHLPEKCVTKVCRGGCKCKKGFVLDADTQECVPPNECKCVHGGQRYPKGSVINKDCNQCTCSAGTWHCTEKICPRTCTVWGESHFKTYDGFIYDFYGVCEYFLTKGKLSGDMFFTLTIQNVLCSTSGTTCSKTFTLDIQGKTKITLSRDKPLPKNYRGTPYVIFESGLYVMVYTQIGVTLQWDKGTRMYVMLDPKWRAKVKGLCGNFNDDQADDFQTRSGGPPEAQADVFGDSWKTRETCPKPVIITDTCAINPHRDSWARRKCDVLKSALFAPCHSTVSLEPYYDRCVFDTCACDEGGDCECLCTSIATYAQECNMLGVHIKWRSQQLCPIQCEECVTYESCMSSCPKKTCENQYLFSGIEEACSREPCVEGCNPKPCAKGQIYNDTKDFKCIPESQCVVPCLEINGKMYMEGSRVTDPSVANPCQSCHCIRGAISCTGQPCASEIPTVTVTTLPPVTVPTIPIVPTTSPGFCVEGWTEFYNVDNPDKNPEHNDDETIKNIRKYHSFCSDDMITDVDCKGIKNNEFVDYKELGQFGVKCSKHVGVFCNKQYLPKGNCYDYAVRFYCSCPAIVTETPSTTTHATSPGFCVAGWTEFYNVDNPDQNPAHNDDETIKNIRKYHSFCSDDMITDVECKGMKNNEFVDYKELGQFGVKCSKHIGLFCNKQYLPKGNCYDYAVRFYCSCPLTEIPGTTTIATTQGIPGVSVSVTCQPGYVYDECAYRCSQTCLYFLNELIQSKLCSSVESNRCVASCRPAEGCQPPMLWRDYHTCVPKEQCTCFSVNENNVSVVIAPTAVEVYECEKCQCVDNKLECYTIPNCGVTLTTLPSFSHRTIVMPDCWTEWINDDTPLDGGGDFELITTMRKKYEFCHYPLKIECRAAIDHRSSSETGQSLQCLLESGLTCWNSQNNPPDCLDYEIRLLCPCAETTISIPFTTLPPSPAAPCVDGWTEWFNSNAPNEIGEYETIQSVRSHGGYFCDNDMVKAIECREKGSVNNKISQHKVVCEVNVGLICKNADQSGGELCHDYEIRFYCDCPGEKTTSVPTVQPTMTTPLPSLEPCEYWSEWINEHHPFHEHEGHANDTSSRPFGDKESKILRKLQHEMHFCLAGDLAGIECRDSENHLDYTVSGDKELICSLHKGFVCRGSHQPSGLCRDYEIRYFCSCGEGTSTIIVTPTITTISIPACTSYYDIIDGAQPLPDNNLRASSSLSEKSGPQSSRLSSTQSSTSDGAWIAGIVDDAQYLQVDFGQLQFVYGVITKGRNGMNEWVKSYKVIYSRDGISYSYVMEPPSFNVIKVFSANYDSDSPVEHIFEVPFEARFVRIQPVSYTREIALRIGILGCREGFTTVTPLPSLICDGEMWQTLSLNEDQISFSSVQDLYALKASAFLNSQKGPHMAGAWVALELNTEQYVQVDFYEYRTVVGVVTQGHHTLPQWVTQYAITFSSDGSTWSYIKDKNGFQKIFSGNFDQTTPVRNMFPFPIIAKHLRIKPLVWHNWISMRFEVLGCAVPETTTVSMEISSVTGPTTSEGCEFPMAYEEHLLKNASVLVSSQLSTLSGASQIKLDTQFSYEGTGGWVAAASDTAPTVLIDFFIERNLSGIVTQGRQDADMWVLTYTVEFSSDNATWQYVIDAKTGSSEFVGNTDRNTKEIRLFNHVIVARYLRVIVKTFHIGAALRLDILGCIKHYGGTTQIPPTATVPTEKCVDYGPWQFIMESPLENISVPLETIAHDSGLCSKPVQIQCREVVSKTDYSKTGQNVICDLKQGFICKPEHSYCSSYEVRIGCYNSSCIPVGTTPGPISLCPEIPSSMSDNCDFCPQNYSCDGVTCVPDVDCPCYKEGKRFKPGDHYITSNCDKCDCILGHSRCEEIICPPCKPGEIHKLHKNCDCQCISCMEGEALCPSDGICIAESSWCDGVADCSDDEVNCPFTGVTPFIPSTISTSFCSFEHDNRHSICEMNMNYFWTFDGFEYQYDVCHNVLVKDKNNGEDFEITVHKECESDNKSICHRYIIIHDGDGMEIKFGPGVDEIEFDGHRISVSNLWLFSKRYAERFTVAKSGYGLVFQSSVYRVQWYGSYSVKVTVPFCKSGQLSGLCGLYNNFANDDFMKSDGTHASSSTDFGNSWSTDPHALCEIPLCDVQLSVIAAHACSDLSQPPLSECHKYLNIASRVAVCMAFICDCLTHHGTTKNAIAACRCQAYENFVEACETSIGGTQTALEGWRIKYGCVPSCPTGLVWEECGPGCELTCDNYHERESLCKDKCTPGCFCPHGLVLNSEGHCIEPRMCLDCICMAHGDPNYLTFDGQFFSFQGNCTYIIAQHQSGDYTLDFQIFGTNIACIEEPLATCTKGWKLLWKNYTFEKVHNQNIRINNIPVLYENTPLKNDIYEITVIPDMSTSVHIKEINLVLYYFDLNYGYKIELPSYLYFSKTVGLCGICNFNQSDDFYHRDGFITTDANEFAHSWRVNIGLSDDETCVHKPFNPPFPRPYLCEFTENDCGMIVPSEVYMKACENDVSYSDEPEKSVCRSKLQYAQQCCERGIILQEWLQASECLPHCQGNMIFQCSSSCLKTCDNYKSYHPDMCDMPALYTCTCPPNLVYKNGSCVDTVYCETCDEQGHIFGDTWNPTPCEECQCKSGGKVMCETRSCPSPPICNENEELVVQVDTTDLCCKTYLCKPVIKNCTSLSPPTCEKGEALVTYFGEDGCPYLKCQCEQGHCPEPVVPIVIEIGEIYVLEKIGCCFQYVSHCVPENCPPEQHCAIGFESTYYQGKCCKLQKCVPSRSVCAVYPEGEIPVDETALTMMAVEYEVGTSWSNGVCEHCSCGLDNAGLPSMRCMKTICPTSPDITDTIYVWEPKSIPGVCCPKFIPVMCTDGVRNYSIGEEWKIEGGDKCQIFKCISNNNGGVIRMTKTTICSYHCAAYARYIEPEENSDECCGHCEVVGCEENGVVYPFGTTWKSVVKPCFSAECKRDETHDYLISYTGVACPPIPTDCPQENLKTSQDGCCSICEQPLKARCEARYAQVEKTVGVFAVNNSKHGICKNIYELQNLKVCSGTCDNVPRLAYSKYTKTFESICQCCKTKKSSELSIKLTCPDNSTFDIIYNQPELCDCSTCSTCS